MSNEEVARILQISPAFLSAIVGSGSGFHRAADGAIEQRSNEHGAMICRREQVGPHIHQVIFDRDGIEDTGLLIPQTTLTA